MSPTIIQTCLLIVIAGCALRCMTELINIGKHITNLDKTLPRGH